MVQTVISRTLSAGGKMILLEKPHALYRIFFSIRALADQSTWYQSKVSFDDPLFRSFYVLNGPGKYFEAKGEGIFQGNIWGQNASTVSLQYTMTEILVNTL